MLHIKNVISASSELVGRLIKHREYCVWIEHELWGRKKIAGKVISKERWVDFFSNEFMYESWVEQRFCFIYTGKQNTSQSVLCGCHVPWRTSDFLSFAGVQICAQLLAAFTAAWSRCKIRGQESQTQEVKICVSRSKSQHQTSVGLMLVMEGGQKKKKGNWVHLGS